jgi:hypothetical protein
MTTDELVSLRLRQLERREEDLVRAGDQLERAKQQAKADVDARRTTRDYAIEPGDWVLVRNDRIFNEFRTERKLTRRWFGPYVVEDVTPGTYTYGLRELDGTRLKGRHTGTRVRLFRRRDALDRVLPLDYPEPPDADNDMVEGDDFH